MARIQSVNVTAELKYIKYIANVAEIECPFTIKGIFDPKLDKKAQYNCISNDIQNKPVA